MATLQETTKQDHEEERAMRWYVELLCEKGTGPAVPGRLHLMAPGNVLCVNVTGELESVGNDEFPHERQVLF